MKIQLDVQLLALLTVSCALCWNHVYGKPNKPYDMAEIIRQINERTDVVEQLLKQYDRNVRPPPSGTCDPIANSLSPAVAVWIELVIDGIDFDLGANTLAKIEYTMRQLWTDSWLSFSANAATSVISLGEYSDKVWHPYTVLHGLYQREMASTLAVLLASNGTVSRTQQAVVEQLCQQETHLYPLGDVIKCSLKLFSSRYSSRDVEYFWSEKPFKVETVLPGNIALSGYKLKNSTELDFYGEPRYALHVDVELKRTDAIVQLVRHFIAHTLLICVMMSGLFLPTRWIVARAIMIVCPFITLIIAYLFVPIPASRVMSYWDIWNVGHFCLAAYAVAVLTLSNYCNKQTKVRSSRSDRQESDYLWKVVESEMPALNIFDESSDRRQLATTSSRSTSTHEQSRTSNQRCRCGRLGKITLPVFVLAFNITYWFFFVKETLL